MTNLNDSTTVGGLTEADFDAALARACPPSRYAACKADACGQRPERCPTPQACQVAEAELPKQPLVASEAVLLVLVYLASAAAVVSVLATLLPVLWAAAMRGLA